MFCGNWNKLVLIASKPKVRSQGCTLIPKCLQHGGQSQKWVTCTYDEESLRPVRRPVRRPGSKVETGKLSNNIPSAEATATGLGGVIDIARDLLRVERKR